MGAWIVLRLATSSGRSFPDTAGWDGHDWTEDYNLFPDTGPGRDGWSSPGARPDVSGAVGDFSRLARAGVQVHPAGSRFRFIIPGTVDPRRVYPSEVVGGGQSRVYPLGSAQLRSNRTAGTYL